MNAYDPAIFAAGSPCLPCCNQPGECDCALLIPPFSSPYADYATALAVVDGSNLAERADCYGYYDGPGTVSGGFSSDVSVANEITLSSVTLIGSAYDMWASITVDAGAVVTVDFSCTYSGSNPASNSATIYACDGTLIETQSSSSDTGTLTFSALSDAGIYYVKCSVSLDGAPTSADYTISSTLLVANPVIALWDDSGTTRKLWACPKLLLPPLTESTGDWYATCADSAGVLTDLVADCLVYDENIPNWTSASATGGSTLTYSVSDSPALLGFGFLCSINAIAGETLTVSTTMSTVGFDIYDDSGILVESVASGSGSVTSSALPYTGRYTLSCTIGGSGMSSSGSATVSSSGTMSTNEAQARYDLGLTCSGNLNCGDTCP